MLKESEKLSHHALQSYIIEQSQNPAIFEYSQLMKHPQINTVSEGLRKLIDLFSYGTTHTLKTTYNGPELNDKQMEHLKRLTILTIFEGRQLVSLKDLSAGLCLHKHELFLMLIAMNTNGLIDVRIDEKAGKCQILWARHREIKSLNHDFAHIAYTKLDMIKNKNQKVIRELDSVELKKKKSFGFMRDF